MKPLQLFILPVLLVSGSCVDATVEAARERAQLAAQEIAQATRQALASAAEALRAELADLDPSVMETEALRERGAWLLGACLTQLDQVRDIATAAQVAASVEATLDAGSELLIRVQGELPSRAELGQQVQNLRTRHAQDDGVLQAIEPALERLEQWLAPNDSTDTQDGPTQDHEAQD
jgi:hypothetical protein